ncbi:ATP-binding protein [Pseudonocardia saturnea]
MRAARFPGRKSLEDFGVDHQRSLKREAISHLGTLDFITARDNVMFLGPPRKTHLSIGLGIRACQAGHRTAFATAAQWVARLAEAHHAGKVQDELVKLGRVPLLLVDGGRLHPLRGRSSEPVLSARVLPRRTRQPHRHLQQALRPLGRGLR